MFCYRNLSYNKGVANDYFMNHARAIFKALLFVFWTILCLFTAILTYYLNKTLHERLIKVYLKTVLKIFNVKVGEKGFENMPKGSMLYVSNHTSYLDIIVLGSRISVRFTPKIEVSKWPVINFLVKMSLPVYIERDASRSLEQKNTIRDIIEGGDSILIFPEATTNDGSKVLPFKSSLFSVVEPQEETVADSHICVQPISIVYTHIDGVPANSSNMDKIAWYGDMKFLPHLWSLFGAKGARVKIIYHSFVYFDDFGDRKTLSKYCKDIISRGVEEAKGSLFN